MRPDSDFREMCEKVIAETLADHGYRLVGEHYIQLLHCMEFEADGRTLFVSSEGGVIHSELLLTEDGVAYRIDLTHAAWHRGGRPRPLPGEDSVGQLTRLAKQLDQNCSNLLAGEMSSDDGDFCFRFESPAQLQEHRKRMTGDR